MVVLCRYARRKDWENADVYISTASGMLIISVVHLKYYANRLYERLFKDSELKKNTAYNEQKRKMTRKITFNKHINTSITHIRL